MGARASARAAGRELDPTGTTRATLAKAKRSCSAGTTDRCFQPLLAWLKWDGWNRPKFAILALERGISRAAANTGGPPCRR
jgi:hypothetical protein